MGNIGDVSYAVEVANAMLGELDPTDSQSRVDYMVDFLGSVTGSTDKNGGLLGSDRRYKPFGEVLSGDPVKPLNFAWTGNTGSMHTGMLYSEQYNRARHYSTTTNIWTTRDPLWPSEHAYGYVNGNPVMWVDPNGNGGRFPWDPAPGPAPSVPLGPKLPFDPTTPIPKRFRVCCDENQSFVKSTMDTCQRIKKLTEKDRKAVQKCMEGLNKITKQNCPGLSPNRLKCLKNLCSDFSVFCVNDSTLDWAGYANGCKLDCDPVSPVGSITINIGVVGSNFLATYYGHDFGFQLTVIHEMMHSCGVGHGNLGSYDFYADFYCNDLSACCIYDVLHGGSGKRCIDAAKSTWPKPKPKPPSVRAPGVGGCAGVAPRMCYEQK